MFVYIQIGVCIHAFTAQPTSWIHFDLCSQKCTQYDLGLFFLETKPSTVGSVQTLLKCEDKQLDLPLIPNS